MVTVHQGNGASALSARSLINSRKLSKAVRAVIGAEILAGEHDLRPTKKLLATAIGCSVAYLQAAQKLSPAERQAVRRGERPLVLPQVPAGPPQPTIMPVPVELPVPFPSYVIANAQHRLNRLVREIGLETVLELLATTEREAA
jgi:hypothetical protein